MSVSCEYGHELRRGVQVGDSFDCYQERLKNRKSKSKLKCGENAANTTAKRNANRESLLWLVYKYETIFLHCLRRVWLWLWLWLWLYRYIVAIAIVGYMAMCYGGTICRGAVRRGAASAA